MCFIWSPVTSTSSETPDNLSEIKHDSWWPWLNMGKQFHNIISSVNISARVRSDRFSLAMVVVSQKRQQLLWSCTASWHHQTIHPSSSTYPGSFCGGSRLIRVFQMSLSPATLSRSSWGSSKGRRPGGMTHSGLPLDVWAPHPISKAGNHTEEATCICNVILSVSTQSSCPDVRVGMWIDW